MAEKLDHKCLICGTMYHACDTCQKVKTFTPWRTLCDTQEHYQILLDIKSYDGGLLTKEEAAADILKRGVKRGSYNDWPEGVRNKLDEILAIEYSNKKSKKKNNIEIIQPVEEPVENSIEDIVSDEPQENLDEITIIE